PSQLGDRDAAVVEMGAEDRAEQGGDVVPDRVAGSEQFEHVLAQRAGVGEVLRAVEMMLCDDGQQQLLLAGPSPIQHRLAGLGPIGDRLEGEAGVSVREELIPARIEDRSLELGPSSPRRRHPTAPLDPLAFLILAPYRKRRLRILLLGVLVVTQSAAAPQAAPAQSSGKLLVALIVGGVAALLDTTIIAIGLQTLTRQLHASVATIQWVSTGYLRALAVAVACASWSQTRFGGKRVWLFALTLFVGGSVLCACAWDAPSLIVFRVVQGLGGGIMFPLMQTLAMHNVAPENRTRTMAAVAIPAALGPIPRPAL